MSTNPIEAWRWGQRILHAVYEPATFVYPLDQPSYTETDHWCHCVVPFSDPAELQDQEARQEMVHAVERAIVRLAAEPSLPQAGCFDLGSTHAEFLTHGPFEHRKRVSARIGRALAASFRSIYGRRLRRERVWFAMLASPEELSRCQAHFGLSDPLLPPTGIVQDYADFMESVERRT
ncbi:MAG: hypothetical protein AAFX94_01555 [Myxococcota bacterium]